MNKKYTIQITMEDHCLILLAFAFAEIHLITEYPEPKRGRESDWKKERREYNQKLCAEISDANQRFNKTCRETMKEVS